MRHCPEPGWGCGVENGSLVGGSQECTACQGTRHVRWRGYPWSRGSNKPLEALLFLLLLSPPGAEAGECPEEITLQVPSAAESKSRISSTSSVSTDLNSLDTSEEGAETPVVQSDEEDLQEDSPKEQVARS